MDFERLKIQKFPYFNKSLQKSNLQMRNLNTSNMLQKVTQEGKISRI